MLKHYTYRNNPTQTSASAAAASSALEFEKHPRKMPPKEASSEKPLSKTAQEIVDAIKPLFLNLEQQLQTFTREMEKINSLIPLDLNKCLSSLNEGVAKISSNSSDNPLWSEVVGRVSKVIETATSPR